VIEALFILQLADLVTLVRGKLSKMSRSIMSALIVMEVHARDVVNKMLEEGAKNVNDFEWISQLRSVSESWSCEIYRPYF
jgi:dynein heavy chain